MSTPRALAGALVVAGAVLVSAPSANAGDYTVYTCRTPDGGLGATLSEWSTSSRVAAYSTRTSACPDGPYAIELLPTVTQPPDGLVATNFWAPANTTIRDYSVWRSADVGDRFNYYENEVSTDGKWTRIRSCSATVSDCRSVGTPTDPFSQANLITSRNRIGLRAIDFTLVCGEADDSGPNCAPARPAGRVSIYRADVTFQDDIEPEFDGDPTGPLVDSGAPLQGVQPLTVKATDKGGGVYQAKLEVDGQIVSTSVLDTNGGKCREPFVARVPCKLSVSGTARLDTSLIPDGSHQLRVLVTDATGTNTATWGPRTIQTANATCNPSPASGAAFVSARLATTGRRSKAAAAVTASYGQKLNLTGTVTGPDGAAVPGATVCVQATDPLNASNVETLGTTVTDDSGDFRYPIAPGPSRRYVVVYRMPSGAATAVVTANVRASASIRASRKRLRNGQTVVLTGQLRGMPIPPGGVLVNMQAIREGHWVGFNDPRQTDAKGRFKFRHRFTRTYGTQRYRLRLAVPRQAGYPYTTGHSPAVTLIVRGR